MNNLLYLLVRQPLYNILAFLSLIFNNNLGWALLTFSIILRLLMWPLFEKLMNDQKKMTKIQPKIKEIQEKYKKEPQTANRLVFDLFKEEKVNPFSSFLFVFLQLFLFIFLFIVIKDLIEKGFSTHLYSFLPKISLNFIFLNINLKQPSLILAIVYTIITFITTLLQKEVSQNKTLLFFPFIILFLYKAFPSALMVFWLGIAFVGLIQEIYLRRPFKKIQKNL